MGDQTTTRTHVRRAQCSFGGEIAGERDRTALISQSASCATFPQSGTTICHPSGLSIPTTAVARRRTPVRRWLHLLVSALFKHTLTPESRCAYRMSRCVHQLCLYPAWMWCAIEEML